MKKALLATLVSLTLIAISHSPLPAQDLWLMKGHDTRRTGQSGSIGPVAVDQEQSWSVPVPGANVINIGASVDRQGVYFGSWGIQRNPQGSDDRTTWDKYDGSVYGYSLEGDPLWGDGRIDLDLVHRCYRYGGRPKDGNDIYWCGLVNDLHVSFYNGTVEGQGAIDTARDVIYVGRGDGRLYAIDRTTGEIRWRYVTYNPELPDDPDGGGEVVTSPLYDRDGTVYFATWAEGAYETNAIYAVNPDGSLRWRYPESTASLDHRFFTSPALSPDGNSIYFSTFVAVDSIEVPGRIYAFDQLADPSLPAAERLKWEMELAIDGDPVITNTMAVGVDGTIYVAGSVVREDVNVPVLFAIEDRGDHGILKWSTPWRLFEDGSQFVLGLALREVDGVTGHLYVTTANGGSPLANWKEEGKIYAVAPGSGAVLGSFDPSDVIPEAIGGLNSPAIDREGRIYVGVRGHYRGVFAPARAPGYYIGLDWDPERSTFDLLWSFRTDSNYIEWTHPAIGPDGGIYAGSAENNAQDSVLQQVYPPGHTPAGTTPRFYAIKGPTSSVSDRREAIPALRLSTWPNPSADRVTIMIDASEPITGPLTIHDVLGRRIAVLPLRAPVSGVQTLVWDAEGIPAGSYFVRVGGVVEGVRVVE